jgi:hypothetical protein
MKILLILATVILVSCGRRDDDNDCRSKEQMRIECSAQLIPNHGYNYAVEVCNRSYSADRCW